MSFNNRCHQVGSGSKVNCTRFIPFKAVDAACIPKKDYSNEFHHHGGAMIAYSSGDIPVVLTETATGTAKDYSFIGFGNSINVAGPLPNPMTLLINKKKPFQFLE